MLDDSMLDKTFWGNAFLIAVVVGSKVWSQGIQSIPYQIVFEKIHDLSNLRVFDCQVFSHIDKSKQRKIGHKSSEGIFVEYASNCLAWLIYNPNTRSNTRTDSVVFNEQWKPNRQGQLNEINSNEIEMKFTKTYNLAHYGGVRNECTPAFDDSSVLSCKKNSSHILVIYSSY